MLAPPLGANQARARLRRQYGPLPAPERAAGRLADRDRHPTRGGENGLRVAPPAQLRRHEIAYRASIAGYAHVMPLTPTGEVIMDDYLTPEQRQWLAIRKEAGLHIDPETAE